VASKDASEGPCRTASDPAGPRLPEPVGDAVDQPGPVEREEDGSEHIVYDALEQISQKTANDPAITLKRAVENVRPLLEVKSRRVGGASYQVPVEVKPQRGTTLAMRWLVNFSRARRENSMSERLVAEIMDASNGAGAAVKRREDMHKMAEANKAFAHYRW